MGYLLFGKSAIEYIIRNPKLQSTDYDLAMSFISYLSGTDTGYKEKDIYIEKTSKGIFFCGKGLEKTFLVIDLNTCPIINSNDPTESLLVLQKVFRFCVRLWSRLSFTSSEKIYNDKGVVFPFPYSTSTNMRVVIYRNPKSKRYEKRNYVDCLFAYKYNSESVSSQQNEDIDLSAYKNAGDEFGAVLHRARSFFFVSNNDDDVTSKAAMLQVKSDERVHNHGFMYLPSELQQEKFSRCQKNIIENDDVSQPIRIEGAAGTGKTVAMIHRAIRLLTKHYLMRDDYNVIFLTHSISTKNVIQQYIDRLIYETDYADYINNHFEVITLLEYSIRYLNIPKEKVIDLDASESKQYQLLMIAEAFSANNGDVLNTYRYLMTPNAYEFFANGSEEGTSAFNSIVKMLQYEFSVRIKGMAGESIDKYYELPDISSGMPLESKEDKEYVYRIFRAYQQQLVMASIYDTDDIILEALGRLNGPIWRREREAAGFDYIFVDEMHLFNLNEQHIFHLLSKDYEQKTIPICFALDYGQLIGDRGDKASNVIETTIKVPERNNERLNTVFRYTPQIMELCASITASGALLFDGFIQPYNSISNGMTAEYELLSYMPTYYLLPSDSEMLDKLEELVKEYLTQNHCGPSNIAIIHFDEEIYVNKYQPQMANYPVCKIDGRMKKGIENNGIIWSLPDYINGLEFDAVFLVGVDGGRVPPETSMKISENFLKYTSFNKLYLACSRARSYVAILGNETRGISPCLSYALEKNTLLMDTSNE